MEREAYLQGILHISQKPHLLGSPVKEHSIKVPLTEFLAEMPHHYSPPSFIYQVPGIRAPPHIPGSPRMERGPHGERCPYPETFLTYLPGSPVKEAPSMEPLMNNVKLVTVKLKFHSPSSCTQRYRQQVSQKATEYFKLMYQTLRYRDMLLCTQIYQVTQQV